MTLILKVVSFSKHFFTFIIQIIRNFKCNLNGARITFGMLIRLCTGWMSDRGVGGSIPGSGKRFFSIPKRHDRVWIPHRLIFNEKWGLFPHGKAIGMWSCTLRLCSKEDKNQCSYAYTPPYAFRVFTGTTLTFTLALKVLRGMQYYKDYLRTQCILALVHLAVWQV